MTGHEKIVDKVAKLLAKAERAGTPEEAETFFAKAQELMTKHAIEQIELENAGQAPQQNITTLLMNDSIAKRDEVKQAKQWLLRDIAEANHCRYLWMVGDSSERHLIIGHETDVEFTALLFQSVMIQMATARGRALKHKRSDVSRYIFVRSFAEGFAVALMKRLKKANEVATTGKELVFVGRKVAVDDFVQDLTGGMRTTSRKPAQKSYDPTAGALGAAAAESVDVSGGRGHLKQPTQALG